MADNPLRRVPSVARLLAEPALAELRGRFAPDQLADAARAELTGERDRLRAGAQSEPDPAALAAAAAGRLILCDANRLRRVINATGVVLHTNLGRALLAPAAVDRLMDVAGGYCNLELDLATGKRSSRMVAVRDGLRAVTGAEVATAVNNCAAATVVTLRALALGREVVVSRGQLIEIGGSFRLPEIMAVSGATLREVGTTNITRLGDYAAAVGPNTGLILRVHPSNYRVRGFTKSVPIGELAALGKRHGIPVVDDAGSGLALDLSPWGVGDAEPLMRAGLAAGADLVLFSGDKLLGGPQAGIIAGRADLVKRVERDPLFRAFRLDKFALAALAATCDLYRDPKRVAGQIPVLRMISTPADALRARAEQWADQLRDVPGLTASVEPADGAVGGGSLPDVPLPGWALALSPAGVGAGEFARRLRLGAVPVVGRVRKGRLLLDARTVLPGEDAELIGAIHASHSGPEA